MNIVNHMYDIEKILEILPHRFPFIFIDRIIFFKKDVSLNALKNISANDFFLYGHFPKKLIFPGVFIIEAIAQASGVLSCLSKNIIKKKKFI